MDLSHQLKLLAQGINPQTGTPLDENSVANTPAAIRLLFSLAEEMSEFEYSAGLRHDPNGSDTGPTAGSDARLQELQQPWSEEERLLLEEKFRENRSVPRLAALFDRSPFAVAVQLQKVGMIGDDEVEFFR